MVAFETNLYTERSNCSDIDDHHHQRAKLFKFRAKKDAPLENKENTAKDTSFREQISIALKCDSFNWRPAFCICFLFIYKSTRTRNTTYEHMIYTVLVKLELIGRLDPFENLRPCSWQVAICHIPHPSCGKLFSLRRKSAHDFSYIVGHFTKPKGVTVCVMLVNECSSQFLHTLFWKKVFFYLHCSSISIEVHYPSSVLMFDNHKNLFYTWKLKCILNFRTNYW